MLLIDSGPAPVLDMFTVWVAEVVPTFWLPKSRLGEESVTAGLPTPLPLRATVWGLPGASSVIVRVPVCEPTAVGEKVTEILHEPPVPIVGQELVWANGPVTATDEIVTVEPLL